jgi:hypothetical protein
VKPLLYGARGTVVEKARGGTFRVRLAGTDCAVCCRIAHEMDRSRIYLAKGDSVMNFRKGIRLMGRPPLTAEQREQKVAYRRAYCARTKERRTAESRAYYARNKERLGWTPHAICNGYRSSLARPQPHAHQGGAAADFFFRNPHTLDNRPVDTARVASSYLFRFQISESSFHFPPTFSQMTTYLPTISCGLSPLVLNTA